MRRLLALLICITLALPPLVEAKVLVVRNWPAGFDDVGGSNVLDGLILSQLNRLGVDYKTVTPFGTRTEWCRTGLQVWNATGRNLGMAAAYTEQFDAVIHLNATNNTTPGYGGIDRPESLGLAAIGPVLVPQIFMGYSSTFTATAGRCSSGQDIAPVLGDNYLHQTKHITTDPAIRWRSGVKEGATLYDPGGGVRALVAQNHGAANKYERASAFPCQDCDSIGVTSDTALVWARLMAHRPDSKQLVYVVFNHLPRGQLDPLIPLMALAYVDSLTGGKVFESRAKIPLQLGIQVRGGWRRGARHLPGGISPNDSTALKASIDSLAALRVPFVVGVNVDSLESYPDDRNWWLRAAPYVRFTPENFGGIDSASAGNGAASWQRPRDMLGRYRNRIIYGDGSAVGADTSIWTLARANMSKVDSAFSGRVDRILIPPHNDWAPYNWRNGRNVHLDSLFSFLSNAGYRGIVTNPTGDGDAPGANNIKSVLDLQKGYPMTMGRSAGGRFKVLATQAYQDSGSARWNRNETVTDGYLDHQPPLKDVQSFFQSAFGFLRVVKDPASTEHGTLGPDSLQTPMSIYTIHASDLGSGVRSDEGTRPTRPGWWQVKYIVNPIRAINKFAGRTIINIAYPEDVSP